MAVYVITGCSRGLGLELARQLAAEPPGKIKTVVATARGQASKGLQEVIDKSDGRVLFVPLDITSTKSAAAAASLTASKVDAVDVLINNGGSINWMSEGIEKM